MRLETNTHGKRTLSAAVHRDVAGLERETVPERAWPTRMRAAAVTRVGTDPRVPFALLLTVYAVLGCTVLRFNRSPLQMAITVASACALDAALTWFVRRERLVPLSAYITGLSLALLLNYSHNYYLLFLPVLFAIGSKHLLTYEGRHVFNPSLFGIALSLILGGDLISPAPAYQWGGTWAMSAFIVMAALALFVFRIGRSALVVSFLGFYVLQILLRAYLMRWYLPPEALLLGTLTSAPFFLFVFYMITDPKTSPASVGGQVATAFALTVVDLGFHTLGSLYTFFYAAFVVASVRLLVLQARRIWREGISAATRRLVGPVPRRAVSTLAALGVAVLIVYRGWLHPTAQAARLNFALEPVAPVASGLDVRMSGAILDLIDSRVRHVGKWLLSAGDTISAGDYDNDGRLDLFLTGPFKATGSHSALFRNLGGFRFQRVAVAVLDGVSADPAEHGVVSSGVFADHDNDGDQDLLLTVGYGRTIVLRNLLSETGDARFEEATGLSGIDDYTISVAANFLDFDRDGRLDLLVANAFNPWLDQYDPPRELSIFRLLKPEYPGDRRMLPFMHASWDAAENGGLNLLYRNLGGGRFERLNSRGSGMPETHWSLAIGTGDLNKDGWTDLYIANDFGPDDLYLNEKGRRFVRIEGRFFGQIGNDTYKGMNSALGDIDRNGHLDIYVSNVHVPLQAEGSLLWMVYPRRDGGFVPNFRDEATERGALNERRFGWGAALGDLNADGWLDIVQVNGMVDDTFDRRFPECRDYWYVNEKLMRAGPEIHTYADMWGDLRGYCINGREANRVYLNRGDRKTLQFVDVASQMGWGNETPSRGALLADLDNDGDLDVGISHLFAPPDFYRNTLLDGRDGTDQPHWVGFLLEGNGSSCNRDAAGSHIVVSYLENGRRVTQLREIHIVNAFAAQGDRRALFGLGSFGRAVDVEVSWCGGPTRRYPDVAVDRYHVLSQTDETLRSHLLAHPFRPLPRP